jgi:hypothetical protein
MEAVMTGEHIITASRTHAKARLGRLADRLRGHGDLPEGPDLDLQDHGDGMDITEALGALPEPPWEGASLPGQPDGTGDGGYRGQTLVDLSGHAPRRYAPDPPGQFPPAVPLPDPGPQADLGRSLIWRDAVRDHFVRQERAHGRITAGPPWYVEYTRIYRKRTGLIAVREPDFALHRWDHVVDEIVAQAKESAEAEWAAAQAAKAAFVTCQEYAGRHAGRSAA